MFPNPKKTIFNHLVVANNVYVQFRTEGATLPERLYREESACLVWGFDRVVPIRDMRSDDEGVSGTLSFGRTPHWCKIPWDNIFAMHTGDESSLRMWPESMPTAIRALAKMRAWRKACTP